MKIYNEDLSRELNDCDLSAGRLTPGKRFIVRHDAVEYSAERYHYETLEEYPNGGKAVTKVIDEPGRQAVDAWDEYEEVSVYVPFTDQDLAVGEIEQLRTALCLSDYKAIKYAEGCISEEEYAPIKAERQSQRTRINILEETIKTENKENGV